jgi:hypothetical protein
MNISSQSSERIRVPVFVAFVAYALAMRVVPYVLHRGFGMEVEYAYSVFPWNFSPIYAIAIFGGAMLSQRAAIAVPLVVLLVSDLVIAAIMPAGWGSYRDQPITYAAFAVLAICGMPLRGRRNVFDVAAAGLGGAILFFLISNFGVWATGGGYSHPQTPAGLLACYRDGLPFFTPTLVSFALFLPALFSPLVLEQAAVPARTQAGV